MNFAEASDLKQGGTGLTATRLAVPALGDPTANGYAHGVQIGPMLWIAGQCGVDPKTRTVPADFVEQCRMSLDRVRTVVEAAGGTLHDIVNMTVFITDTSKGRLFTNLRHEYFGGTGLPTSALIGVTAMMPPGAMIEIQAQAVLGSAPRPSPESASEPA